MFVKFEYKWEVCVYKKDMEIICRLVILLICYLCLCEKWKYGVSVKISVEKYIVLEKNNL